jgi:hypothetical protein
MTHNGHRHRSNRGRAATSSFGPAEATLASDRKAMISANPALMAFREMALREYGMALLSHDEIVR